MDANELASSIARTERLHTVNYVLAVSLVLLFYDYFLTLPSEIELIWKAKFNIVKVLFLLSRYPTFIDVPVAVYMSVMPDIPRDQCIPLNNISSWLTVLGIGIAEAIILLRTYAIWGRSRKVLFGLSALLAAFYIPSLAITAIFLRPIKAGSPPFPWLTGCFLVGGSPIIFFNFVFLILFETVIVVMTSYKGYKTFLGSRDPLIATLYRDGILFFIFLFLISLTNVLILSLGPNEYQNLITTFQRVMHSLLSCRVLLHVREVNRIQTEGTPLREIRVHSPRTSHSVVHRVGSPIQSSSQPLMIVVDREETTFVA
jgi:hypothetical protein